MWKDCICLLRRLLAELTLLLKTGLRLEGFQDVLSPNALILTRRSGNPVWITFGPEVQLRLSGNVYVKFLGFSIFSIIFFFVLGFKIWIIVSVIFVLGGNLTHFFVAQWCLATKKAHTQLLLIHSYCSLVVLSAVHVSNAYLWRKGAFSDYSVLAVGYVKQQCPEVPH